MQAWISALDTDLKAKFDRLHTLGVKFNWKTLRALAVLLIEGVNFNYSKNTVDPNRSVPIPDSILQKMGTKL